MLDEIVPAAAVAVEAFEDVAGEEPFPGEEAMLAGAVEKRRREFVTARRCAREALARLGHPPAPIAAGPRREPIWPPGVSGSITHCTGYRAAVVAPKDRLASIGIDAEPHEPLPVDVWTTVGRPGEVPPEAVAGDGIHWERLIFCAKESIYKAWYPLTKRWLGFEDVELRIHPAARTFTAGILIDPARSDGGPPLREVHGRYLIRAGLVLTAVTVD